jgi:hypothetical protein
MMSAEKAFCEYDFAASGGKVRRTGMIVLILFCLSRCTSTPSTPPLSEAEALTYLHDTIVGWARQSDMGTSTYEDVTLTNCLLVVRERMDFRNGTRRVLQHEYPLASLTETEWYGGLPPAGKVAVDGLGVRLHWMDEPAARYTNYDFLEVPPEQGQRVAEVLGRLHDLCASQSLH